MEIGRGVKGIIMDKGQVLVLVEPNGNVDLPGGRVEEGEAMTVFFDGNDAVCNEDELLYLKSLAERLVTKCMIRSAGRLQRTCR